MDTEEHLDHGLRLRGREVLTVRKAAVVLSRKGGFATDSGICVVVGIILVGLGAVMGVLAYIRYRSVERQIENDNYAPLPILSVLLMLSVLAVGLFLVLYLIHTM